MKINDLETLKIVISKEVPLNLTEKFDIIKVVNDIENHYDRPLSRLSRAEVLDYIKDYVFDENVMEDILMEVFPEIDFKYGN